MLGLLSGFLIPFVCCAFHLSSSSSSSLPPQLNSAAPSSLPSPPFLPSAQHFVEPLISSRLLSPFSSVRFVLWLQRLNLLTKHTKSHMCMCLCTQVKKTHTHFSLSPGPRCILGYVQLVRSKTRAASATAQPAPSAINLHNI